MPNRGIKESILTSKTIDRLSPLAERFFYRLLLVCDDYGRTEADPAILRSRCFPRQVDRVSVQDVEGWLRELEAAPLIIRYTVGDHDYLQFIKWEEHQRRPRGRPARSRYPAPPATAANASIGLSSEIQPNACKSSNDGDIAETQNKSEKIAHDGAKWGPLTSETSETIYTPPETPPSGGSALAAVDTLLQDITPTVRHPQAVHQLVRLYFSRNRPSGYRSKRQLTELVSRCAACFDEALDDWSQAELEQAIRAAPRRRWWWQIVEDLGSRKRAPPEHTAPPEEIVYGDEEAS